MASIRFLCLHRPNRSPSQRFRFEQYIPWLESHGHQTCISHLLDERGDRCYYAPHQYGCKARILTSAVVRRIHEAFLAAPADVAFVQREAFMLGTAVFERQFARRSRLLFDFDDSIWLQEVSSANRRLAFLKNADKTRDIIRASHLVVAGNPYLAAYAGQYTDRVTVVPTTIDTERYTPRPHREGPEVVVGWSGSFSTTKHFAIAADALLAVRARYGARVRFVLIGDASYRHTGLGIQGSAWNPLTEVEDLSSLDIGIMPLPDDEWSRGKCGLKGLQYMALGIPTVMSPVGVNAEIIDDGVNGFLAASTEEWVEKLSLLIDSIDARRALGARGRETVEQRYSVLANRHRYLELIDAVLR